MSGAFHEGLRDAMRDTRSPQEIAILNDQRLAERGVVERARQEERAFNEGLRVIAEQQAAEQRIITEHDRRPFDLCVTAGAEFKVITDMARAMEAEGDTPALTWFRDENSQIVGVKLVGHLSRKTIKHAHGELRYEPVTP